METLNYIISLLSKTEGRDKTLRLIQYATISSSCHKGVFTVVYDQVKTTRKILRFLRTLEYIALIRKEIPEAKKHIHNPKYLITKILLILENIFAFLYHIADHRMSLSEFGLIDEKERKTQYEKGMKFYKYQNIAGILRNLFHIFIIVFEDEEDDRKIESTDDLIKEIKPYIFDMIKCFLDAVIVRYYQNESPLTFKTVNIVGSLGVITSIISICQILKFI